MSLELKEESELNEELLSADTPCEQQDTGPRRNSKQGLIEKIIEISERDGIPLEHSNTKLKRMNKQQLTQLCADMVEKGIRKKMARSVGAAGDSDQAIALGALRMIHDVCAVGVQKGGNMVSFVNVVALGRIKCSFKFDDLGCFLILSATVLQTKDHI